MKGTLTIGSSLFLTSHLHLSKNRRGNLGVSYRDPFPYLLEGPNIFNDNNNKNSIGKIIID